MGSPRQPEREFAGKLRPRIKLPELAVSPSRSPRLGATRLACFKRVRHRSLLSLPQLRGYTTGCPPECQRENPAAGTSQPHFGAFLHDLWQAAQTGMSCRSCSGSYGVLVGNEELWGEEMGRQLPFPSDRVDLGHYWQRDGKGE